MRSVYPAFPPHPARVAAATAARVLPLLAGLLCFLSAPGRAPSQVPTNSPVVPDVSPSVPVVEPPLPSADDTTAAPLPNSLTAPSAAPVETAPVEIDQTGSAVAAGIAVPNTSARRFQYAFRLALSAVYDDNISLRGNSRSGDFYFTIEPGVTVGLGNIVERSLNYVRLDYAPSAYFYANQTEANALQHLIRLEGQYVFTRLTVAFSQDVQILDGADLNVATNTGTVVNRVNLDVGTRTKVNIYVTRGLFTYNLSDKSALALALLYNNNAYQTLISSQTASADFSYNYTYSPKLTLSAALTAGYLSIERDNPSQSYQQLNLRAAYQTSAKLAINAAVGLEARQFEGSSDNNVTPVLELGLIYQPFDGTLFNLSASRRVLSSALLDAQDYTTSGFVASLRQRFFQRFFLGLTMGYEHASYFTTANVNGGDRSLQGSRADDYFYVQPSIEARITEKWSATLFYMHRENVSSLSSTSFDNNQVGIRASYNF